jgi:hypothetical protein
VLPAIVLLVTFNCLPLTALANSVSIPPNVLPVIVLSTMLVALLVKSPMDIPKPSLPLKVLRVIFSVPVL